MLSKDALSVEVRGRLHEKKLCHNCDTKPVLAAKTDFFDRMCLLILRNLLKTKVSLKNPTYRLARYFFAFVFLCGKIQLIQISRTAGEWVGSARRAGGYGARYVDRTDRMRHRIGVGAGPHEL